MPRPNQLSPIPKKKAGAPAAAPQAPPLRPQIPDKTRLGILVQSYMVALSQANLTGNFSVLRDMGSPDFQQRNSPAQLADIFSSLRKGNIDLTPIIVYSPTLSREPEYDTNGLLASQRLLQDRAATRAVRFGVAAGWRHVASLRHFGRNSPGAAQTMRAAADSSAADQPTPVPASRRGSPPKPSPTERDR